METTKKTGVVEVFQRFSRAPDSAEQVVHSIQMIAPPIGEVHLSEKLTPICDRCEPHNEFYAFTRATVDISKFKEKLQTLPPEIWSDENQTGNVQLIRPAHDKWGIKKIVFTFCDDFLQKVYDLPWSRDEEWRQHLLPIYNAIGIDESRVVRCLLASMPPNMSIPVHHDTGYWVKHTHRLHVAIDTNVAEVDFMVGPTEDELKKYTFDEGRIVELNNQAKHAVTNHMQERWRVHLIFDYVDDFPLPSRLLLAPGEKVNQTRRSIDLAREAGSRLSPSFVIIGAQKSGTTSMYEYLCQHPLVVRGKRRETHFLDWRWQRSLKGEPEQRAFYLNFFEKEMLFEHPSLMTGESTPSYLLHSEIVIPRFLAVCPWAKVLVMLRDPVERAYSQYQMCIDPEGTPVQLAVRGKSSYTGKSFTEVVNEEIAELTAVGIEPGCSFDIFQEKISSTRPMDHGGHSVVARGLYALQLEPWLEALPRGQVKVLALEQIKGSHQKVQGCMDDVFGFVGLPPHDLTKEDASPRNTRAYTDMEPEVRTLLEKFYEPFNQRLRNTLVKFGHDVDKLTALWIQPPVSKNNEKMLVEPVA